MTNKVTGISKNNNYSPILKDQKNNFLLSSNEIHPAMVMEFINDKLTSNSQKGGDGYTIDVNKSINGMVGWSRYSFNYAPIIYGDLLENTNKGCNVQKGGNNCGCNSNSDQDKSKSIYDILQQNGGAKKMKVNQFDAIQQVGKGLVPLSVNSLINLVLLIFLYHSVVDGNVDNKKIKKSIKKGGSDLVSVIAPLGRGNLLILASLLLLHHFAIEKPKLKKELKGGSNIYGQINKILEPLGLKNSVSPILTDLFDSFKSKNNKNKIINTNNELKGGSILKSIIAPLGTNAFIATGLLIIMKKILLDKDNKKIKKGGAKKDFNKLVNLLGPLSFNAFANENFVKEIFKINKNNKK